MTTISAAQRQKSAPAYEPSCSPPLVGNGSEAILETDDVEQISNYQIMARLRAADSELHQFISMAAHELREPLHAIQGFLSVVLRERVGPLGALQHEFLSSAYVAGRRMERLVDDLQVLVVGERGFPMHFERVDLLEHANACVRELAPQAEGYGVRVVVDARGAGPWIAWCDPVRIDQVLLNLIENAMRYSDPAADIVVRLRRAASGVQMTVHNAVDVKPREHPRRWFTAFVRGHQGHERTHGLGLGLSVAQHIVERHGGRITACALGTRVAIRVHVPRSAPETLTEAT